MIPTLQAMDRAGAKIAVVSRDPGSGKFSDVLGVVTAAEIGAHVGHSSLMLS